MDHVQINVVETVGVEHRAGYYDKAGVLKDMFQNHLLQLMSLIAMEPPSRYEADALRDEKVKVLQAVRTEVKSVRAKFMSKWERDIDRESGALRKRICFFVKRKVMAKRLCLL